MWIKWASSAACTAVLCRRAKTCNGDRVNFRGARRANNSRICSRHSFFTMHAWCNAPSPIDRLIDSETRSDLRVIMRTKRNHRPARPPASAVGLSPPEMARVASPRRSSWLQSAVHGTQHLGGPTPRGLAVSACCVAALACSDRRPQEKRRPQTEKNRVHRVIRALEISGRSATEERHRQTLEVLTANPEPLLSSFPAKKISFPGADGEGDEPSSSPISNDPPAEPMRKYGKASAGPTRLMAVSGVLRGRFAGLCGHSLYAWCTHFFFGCIRSS
jgi:hypothetical protein